ncbi:erythromycin esterase family protein [Marinimicrobium alkaliphilum]|uniref:erythromycin esterase family protein n=1 Tax=Marinimicrobium alkaliphilum TaxID=2202654 RepID=UPI000DB9C019|nr:erythromycin esterase family protein [Marinimicrobium alkaliphilum]
MIRTCIHACLATLLALTATVTNAESETDDVSRYQRLFKEIATAVEAPKDLAPLYSAIGDRRAVLLGEASHGTREFYQWRAEISQHLIEHKGFAFVGLEGDWSSIYQLNRYIKGQTPEGQSARDVMRADITRWPQWMWANEEFADFVEWLRAHNDEREADDKVGLYGLDMQDPEGSMAQVLAWFEQNDEARHGQVADAYRQITRFPENFRGYAQHLMRGGDRLEDAVRLPVTLLREAMGDYPSKADKAQWAALQNALAVKRAEAQFHGAASRGPESWNARARYMHEAYLRIAERHGDGSKGIVWAHNTHVGDARATDMRNRGEVNIGQLMRESEGEDDVFILGFSTHRGTVIAGAEWGNERQTMTVVPAHPQSVDAALHKAELDQHLLLFGPDTREDQWLIPMHKRAIGVIYRPPNEAYVPTLITLRYDALLYFDKTRALTPLNN